ncbi:MAG TPA: hypothetical protein VGM88_18740 [Kofleriaceae bacterium]|jgi:hypothetical protein
MREAAERGFAATVKKRWRAWLRAVHRDIGYLAVGFTFIYALSGIALNHIADWDPSFHNYERTVKIAPLAANISNAEAAKLLESAVGMDGAPTDTFRAGDETRLTFANGAKVTAIGDTATVQGRTDRFFFRFAVWLHAVRGKALWKFLADIYAGLLLYLAISGLFMLKGKLGLRWRGAILAGAGVCIPLGYLVLSGGPNAQKSSSVPTEKPGETEPAPEPIAAPAPAAPGSAAAPAAPGSAAAPASPGSAADGITPLPEGS